MDALDPSKTENQLKKMFFIRCCNCFFSPHYTIILKLNVSYGKNENFCTCLNYSCDLCMICFNACFAFRAFVSKFPALGALVF